MHKHSLKCGDFTAALTVQAQMIRASLKDKTSDNGDKSGKVPDNDENTSKHDCK
jgi:hypothetical protein